MACRSDEPTAGIVEIDEATALSFAFVMNTQFETVATEPFPECVAGVAFMAFRQAVELGLITLHNN